MSSDRVKQVGHLKDLLNKHQAFDEKSLRRLIAGKSEIQHGEVTFKVLRPAEIELDSEQRFHKDSFEFRATIFDCEHIRLRDSSKVNLIDCVVIGSLSVGTKFGKQTEIYLDTVAVTGELRVSGRGRDEPRASVYLGTAQASTLVLYNVAASDVTVFDSRFASTDMHLVDTNSLSINFSETGSLGIVECNFKEVFFPAGQVNLGDLKASRPLARLRRWKFKPSKFVVGPKAIDRALNSASRSEAKRREIETLKFLFEKTEIPHSKRDAAHLKYLRSLSESSSWMSRTFVFVTGGFIKPSRIALWAAAVIVGFASIYWREACSFGPTNPICPIGSYWDALYFSGLTFTTIGYGDIVPLHSMRGFAVFEGLLGVALGGAWLVSLTRRYIE